MKNPSLFKSLSHATRGIKTALKEERNFRIHLAAAFIILGFVILFNFNWIESSLVILSCMIVLIAELVNTSIEKTWDHLNPEHHPIIGSIKDTMAGSVMVASLGAIIIGGIVFVHHFAQYFV